VGGASRVRRTPLAERDLEDIWFFVAQDNPDAADRLLERIDESIKLLAENPYLGPARPDIAPELRYHPVGHYLLLYRILKNGIELVRVVHGARHWLSLFQ
jgi:toxin ParE1/3/4